MKPLGGERGPLAEVDPCQTLRCLRSLKGTLDNGTSEGTETNGDALSLALKEKETFGELERVVNPAVLSMYAQTKSWPRPKILDRTTKRED